MEINRLNHRTYHEDTKMGEEYYNVTVPCFWTVFRWFMDVTDLKGFGIHCRRDIKEHVVSSEHRSDHKVVTLFTLSSLSTT
jgi:hypothetical protein